MRRLLTALAAFTVMTVPASARPAEVGRALPHAQMVGEASYEVLSVRLFSAELWADRGAFSWNRPFALSLTYERAARASALVNRSIREMTQRGAGSARTLAPLRTQLERCLPNVARGDRITGVSTSANTARFYVNGAERCDLRWPGFRRYFFGMWLAGRDGPAARLSAQLRGEA
ncbi:MAG: hypothetical protein ACT4OF_04670 [Caulobacteraceae bacterium]